MAKTLSVEGDPKEFDRNWYLSVTAKAILSRPTGKTYGISSPSKTKKGEMNNELSNR